ncbi:Transcriptional regulator, contains XRE-family HTH domain [Dyadobacter koreensis]|uniref:Transcriptional regulator, contains XRE-family HTH domain n=1 Tax=Dyadobacter koreensis TaxID=408657 RepID=A0A1H6XMT7_9BACT|nr:helix-turn-helix domain-containing protein [Dyadobacter koreensis]SEJ26150.1 Transcriptional regulator, contains XRE-family HTH domain [Dyadobacter koreensis]
MNAQEIFLSQNLKFLRKRKKKTQEQLAEHLGMSRDKLKAIETGKTINPTLDDLIRFSRYFKMAADTLLTVSLSKLGELKIRELENGSDVYQTGSKLRVLAITTGPEDRENVEYVSLKAKAGYRAGFSDPEYLASLPKFNVPNLPSGSFRMFPTVGDSMLPIPEGSEILARYVQDWRGIKAGTLCVVILSSEQDLVFKQVTMLGPQVLLTSLNKLYQEYTVELSEVIEIWEYYAFFSRDVPEAVSDLGQVIREIRMLGEKVEAKGF